MPPVSDGMTQIEELAHRPRRQMRALVVEEDHLVRRIRSRAVDLLARRLRRQVSVLGEELAGDGTRHALEIVDAVEGEAAEEQRTVDVEPRFDLVAVRRGPFGEVDALHRGPHDQRQRIAVDRARLDELRDVDCFAAHRADSRRLACSFSGPCLAHVTPLSLHRVISRHRMMRISGARAASAATASTAKSEMSRIVHSAGSSLDHAVRSRAGGAPSGELDVERLQGAGSTRRRGP